MSNRRDEPHRGSYLEGQQRWRCRKALAGWKLGTGRVSLGSGPPGRGSQVLRRPATAFGRVEIEVPRAAVVVDGDGDHAGAMRAGQMEP